MLKYRRVTGHVSRWRTRRSSHEGPEIYVSLGVEDCIHRWRSSRRLRRRPSGALAPHGQNWWQTGHWVQGRPQKTPHQRLCTAISPQCGCKRKPQLEVCKPKLRFTRVLSRQQLLIDGSGGGFMAKKVECSQCQQVDFLLSHHPPIEAATLLWSDLCSGTGNACRDRSAEYQNKPQIETPHHPHHEGASR